MATIKLHDLNIYDFGNDIGLAGAVFTGNDGGYYLVMFPDQQAPVGSGKTETLELNDAEWKKLMYQLDAQEVEVLRDDGTGVKKAILRKSQRLIEQRVSWAVFKRDGYRCRYCNADGIPLTVDHLITWEDGGPSVEENLVAACRKCNKVRGNISFKDWLQHKHYLHVSQKLPKTVREANENLLPTLVDIRLRMSERATRK